MLEEQDFLAFLTYHIGMLICLVPENSGIYYEDNNVWKKILWDKYYMQMPEQRRQLVERSVNSEESIAKVAVRLNANPIIASAFLSNGL